MVLNVLTFSPGVSILHIPGVLGKTITQGSLQAALLLVLTVNRKVIIRPNFFLGLVTLLTIETVMTVAEAQYLTGTAYRTFRLVEFVIGLWLFTPFWGRRDLLIARAHLKAMTIVIGSVVIGYLIAPGRAKLGGRLEGVIWPIPPTQVAHYAAVLIGLVAVLWFCGYWRGKPYLLVVDRGLWRCPASHPYKDSSRRIDSGPPGRGPEPDRDRGSRPQAVHSGGCGGDGSGTGLLRSRHRMAGPGSEQPAADRPQRPG